VQLNVPLTVLASIKYDHFRKPHLGLWKKLLDINAPTDLDLKASFYVGDAAGRIRGWKKSRRADFACSDRKFAINAGVEFFTPEEFFFKEEPAPFELGFDPDDFLNACMKLEKVDRGYMGEHLPEIIVFVGSPASGKTSFAQRHLLKANYTHINQDALKSRDKCVRAAIEALESGKSVVIGMGRQVP
jgi:bifunctional polynucleotide phosphatase/kinase